MNKLIITLICFVFNNIMQLMSQPNNSNNITFYQLDGVSIQQYENDEFIEWYIPQNKSTDTITYFFQYDSLFSILTTKKTINRNLINKLFKFNKYNIRNWNTLSPFIKFQYQRNSSRITKHGFYFTQALKPIKVNIDTLYGTDKSIITLNHNKVKKLFSNIGFDENLNYTIIDNSLLFYILDLKQGIEKHSNNEDYIVTKCAVFLKDNEDINIVYICNPNKASLRHPSIKNILCLHDKIFIHNSNYYNKRIGRKNIYSEKIFEQFYDMKSQKLYTAKKNYVFYVDKNSDNIEIYTYEKKLVGKLNAENQFFPPTTENIPPLLHTIMIIFGIIVSGIIIIRVLRSL